jgi:hypothetical protein
MQPTPPEQSHSPSSSGFSRAHELQAALSEQSHEPESDVKATAEQIRRNATFSFVYCEHSAETAEQVGRAAHESGAEIVAIEAVCKNAAERRYIEDWLNELLISDDPSSVQNITKNGFPEAIVRSVAGQAREIRLVDMNNTDPVITELQDKSKEARTLKHQLIMNLATNERIEAMYTTEAWFNGASIRARDKLVRDQLLGIAADTATEPVTIATIQGSTHTGTQHGLAADNFRTNRVFVTGQTLPKGQKEQYGYPTQAVREVSVGAYSQPNPDTIHRAFLDDMYAIYGPEDWAGPNAPLEERLTVSRQILEQMSNDAVIDILEQIDTVKQDDTRNDKLGAINEILRRNAKTILDAA